MTRIITSQPATSRAESIAVSGLATAWTTLMQAPDFSVPDATVRWPSQRDPADATRRIQPGQALLSTPVYVYNRHTSALWVEFRILTQAGLEVMLGRVTVPPEDTFVNPIAGLTVLKTDLAAANGGRLQARAQTAALLDVIATAQVGSAEQDQPQGV